MSLNHPEPAHRYKGQVHASCAVEGCTRIRNSTLYCSTHYMRLQRTGTTERMPIQPLKLSEMSPIGLNITGLRYRDGMSLAKLSLRAKVAEPTLWGISRGESGNLETLWRVCAVFNVEPWRLLKPDEFPLPEAFLRFCK